MGIADWFKSLTIEQLREVVYLLSLVVCFLGFFVIGSHIRIDRCDHEIERLENLINVIVRNAR